MVASEAAVGAAAPSLPAMPDIEHPAFGFLRWPPDRAERSWQPLPCKSITLESRSNYPSYVVRTVTLFRDGRARAHNSYEKFATRKLHEHEPGSYEATVAHESYGLLCYLIERADFWRLEREYSAQLRDCSWHVVTVEGERETRSVTDRCARAPVDVVAFEYAFEQIAARLYWKRTADESQPNADAPQTVR